VLPPLSREHNVPRFFFHLIDGKLLTDEVGTELANADVARL
jgi:hypothetical protein